MRITDKITITQEDNMALMARYPDNYFDLAIVDPPYGIGEHGGNNSKRTGGRAKARNYKPFAGNDKDTPSKEYFDELFRVSKNQIIWGGNYMVEHLTKSMGWIFWDKDTGSQDFSDGELAYTSFNRALKKYKYTWCGFRQGPTNQRIEDRIHPTQKPVALYKWLLENYGKRECNQKHTEDYRYLCSECNNGTVKILDTHLGSGSIAIACHDYGFELTACELDKEYFDKAIERITNHVSQQRLF